MKTISIILFFLVLVSILGSCTIQKRVFNNGYHVEWKRKFKQSAEPTVSDEKMDDASSRGNQQEIGHEAIEETILKQDTINQQIIDGAEQVTTAQSDRVINAESENEERVGALSHEKKITSFKPFWYRAYGGDRSGAKALVIIIIFAILFLLIYAALNSGNYAAMFLLLVAAGWLLIILFIVLFILLLVRLFMGPYR